MKVYNLVICDHRADVEVESFATKEAAIDRANEVAAEECYNRNNGPVVQNTEGWVYHIQLTEEDYLFITECELEAVL